MSAGNLLGATIITVLVGGLLMVIGKVVDIFASVANTIFSNGVYYQGGIDGFNMMITVFRVLGVIIIAGVWANYMLNEISTSSKEV
jgi:flagellar biosynthesis protein FlhB